MKIIRNLALLTSLSLSSAFAAVPVAIIDSGVDYQHVELASQMWQNVDEVMDNEIDDDNNGYMDDVWGWNFAGANGEVIDYQYSRSFTPNVKRFFEIQAKMLDGTATQDEVEWVQRMLNNPFFRGRLMTYGNYAHGTHVAGIVAAGNPAAQIQALKLIPTSLLPSMQSAVDMFDFRVKRVNPFVKWLLKQGLGWIARQQGVIFADIADYLKKEPVGVANGSFGTGMAQARTIAGALLGLVLQDEEPDPADVEELAKHFVNEAVKAQKVLTSSNRNTLFVFAAGNDGSNNDELPVAPANIGAVNSMSVAACGVDMQLAVFSNWGKDKVDLCAMGVAIDSTTPNDNRLKLSGTSQAAPAVAGVAASIREINPDASVREVKRILMETVDTFDHLNTKLRSGGVLNAERALTAAELSNTMSVRDAIATAREQVADQAVQVSTYQGDAFVTPLPSPFRLN